MVHALIASLHVLLNFALFKQSQQVQWILYLWALGYCGEDKSFQKCLEARSQAGQTS